MNNMTDLSALLRHNFKNSGLYANRLADSLNRAILNSDVDHASQLIGYGANIHQARCFQMPKGSPVKTRFCAPLDLALVVGNAEMVQLLLERGARSLTAFQKLGEVKNLESLRLLVKTYAEDHGFSSNLIGIAFKTQLQRTKGLPKERVGAIIATLDVFIDEAPQIVKGILLPDRNSVHPDILKHIEINRETELRSGLGRLYGIRLEQVSPR